MLPTTAGFGLKLNDATGEGGFTVIVCDTLPLPVVFVAVSVIVYDPVVA